MSNVWRVIPFKRSQCTLSASLMHAVFSTMQFCSFSVFNHLVLIHCTVCTNQISCELSHKCAVVVSCNHWMSDNVNVMLVCQTLRERCRLCPSDGDTCLLVQQRCQSVGWKSADSASRLPCGSATSLVCVAWTNAIVK